MRTNEKEWWRQFHNIKANIAHFIIVTMWSGQQSIVKVLGGDIQLRIRKIIRRVCAENGIDIINGVVSDDRLHLFISMPRKISMSDLMGKVKS